MNKKEFIEKLKGHGAWCTECHDINGEKDRYVKVAKVRELLEQLDEPQKVKVPAFVAPFIDKLKTTNRRYGFELERTYESSEDNDLRKLYTVTINLDRKYHLVVDEGDGDDEIGTTLTTSRGVLGYRYFLTEKEIKAIDERYWPFAVPVDGSVEEV